MAGNIPNLNAEIAGIAAAHGIPLVDVYGALVSNVPAFISSDNLHPTAAGHHVMAETFFAAIRETFDITPTGSLPARAHWPPRVLSSPRSSTPDIVGRRRRP